MGRGTVSKTAAASAVLQHWQAGQPLPLGRPTPLQPCKRPGGGRRPAAAQCQGPVGARTMLQAALTATHGCCEVGDGRKRRGAGRRSAAAVTGAPAAPAAAVGCEDCGQGKEGGQRPP